MRGDKMLLKPDKVTVPHFELSSKDNQIVQTKNFMVCLDQDYQQVPGILTIHFKSNQTNWDILATDYYLCQEFCQVIILAELIAIRAFKPSADQQQLERNICNALVNFNGEQIIDQHGQKEVFVRQVPRYKESYVLRLNGDQDHVFYDLDYGKGFFFGPALSQQSMNIEVNNKLLEILRQTSEPDHFLEWFNQDVTSILQKTFNDQDPQFNAHNHPSKTGLCEITMPSGDSYSFVLIPECQSQLYRTILTPQTYRYPALRFMSAVSFNEMFILFKIWSESIAQITNRDFVYKIAVLMNYAAPGRQQVHVHLIPSYNIDNRWERFASEPYVHNIKGDHEYQNLEQVAALKGQNPETFIKNFQDVLIDNLKLNNIKIDWP